MAWNLLLRLKALLQGGANLDTMRSSAPQPPAAYQQTGTLPPATYDDPRPMNTANYSSYLTEMTSGGNATGIAGGKPMQSVDPTAGSASVGGFSYNLDSQNFNFTAPVLALAGRAGMGISLALSDNNKVWLRDANTNTVIFNPNRDFPAPGWRIGFGSILVKSQADPPYTNSFTGKQSLLYVAPDGTRRDLAYNSSSGYYESYDASYLRFDLANKILYMPDGARAAFLDGSYANGAAQFLPTWIKDRNGNTINIYYKTLSNSAVVLDYVIDTAARRIDFNYQNNRLVSVSQNRGGSTFYFIRIDYNPVTIQTSFSGSPALDPSNINNSQVYFPVRLSYPNGMQYRFGYNSYGQVSAIEKWVPTITGQGNERKIASTTFVYSGGAPYTAPAFSQRQEWAENWQGGQTQTYQYTYWGASGHVVLDPTLREFRVWNNGLNHSSSIWASGAGNFTKKDEVTYVTDSGLPSGGNPRISQTKSTAWNGTGYNIRTTNIGYTQLDGMWLPSTKDDLLQDGTTVYRRTTTGYTSYPSRYILGLPQTVSVYAGAGTTLLSRSTSNYDETGTYTDSNGQTANYFIDAGGANVVQHDSSYNIGLTQRGNLTSVVQSSVVNGAVTGTRTVKRLSYDTNGNLRAEADGAANRKQFQYGDYCVNKPGGVGETHLVPYTASDPTGFRSGSQWEYYTGLTIKSFNMLSGGSTELQVVTTSYDFADRPLQTTRPDGGWAKTAYWDNWLATVGSRQVDAGKVGYKFEQYDGAGRAYKKASDYPDGASNKFSGQISVFDKVGQVEDSSNVIAINGSWVPLGDTMPDGQVIDLQFRYTHLTRDELSRLKLITHPDGDARQVDYTGCGCAGNSETRVTDEVGHYTITKTDFLGRLIEAIEPSGSTYDGVYSKAVYVYDALDRLVTINHSKTPTGGQTPTQTRTFGYDGYGRLQSENTPEGGIVNYSYTANDLVWTTTNQRGITVTNSYNTRNLLTQTSYSDGTPTATFGHDAHGARNSMADGEGATSYSYNNYRQLESEMRTFTALAGKSYKLSYTYNQGDQLKSVNYRATTGASPGDPVTYGPFGSTWQPPYRIDGTVRDQQSQPVSGVTIAMEGGASGQTTSNGSGAYSFSGLQPGTYTLVPSLSGHVFNPSSITYLNLNRNRTGADFTALPAEQTIYDKTVNYDYNAVGALSGVGTNLIGSDPNATTNVLNTVSFRASGALKTLHYGNGRRLRMNYWELRSQPKGMTVDRTSNPSDKIIDYLYEYNDASGNNNNRIRKITDNVDTNYTTTYLYDDYNRLTHATSNASSSYFLYDEWGNIKNLSGLQINHATNASGAPATNRISTAVSGSTTLTHTYDAAGNTTNDGTKTMDYDGANRLKAVNGTASTYGYDGNGMRARVTDGGAATFYVHSAALGQNAIEVTNAGVQRAYVYAGSKMVAMQATDGQFYWTHSNHLGSSQAMTDSNGNLTYRGQLAPFGEAISEWSSSGNTNLNKKKFTGYERDAAIELDYANARMYLSGRGRFMTPDVLGLRASDVKRPQTLNRYVYVNNDPVNFVDPTGLAPLSAGDREFLCRYGIIGNWWCGEGTVVVRGESGIGRVEGRGGSGITIEGGGVDPSNSWQQALEKAIRRVKDILKEDGSCKEFYGPTAVAALEALESKFQIRPDYSGGAGATPTGISMRFSTTVTDQEKLQGFRVPEEAVVKRNGPFFANSGAPSLGGYTAGSDGAQMIAILHEVAHMIIVPLSNGRHTYLIPNDGNNPGQSSTNTDTVKSHCGDQVHKHIGK